MNLLAPILFLIFSSPIFAQQLREPLVKVKGLNKEEYELTISNKSDKVLCIITSAYFSYSSDLELAVFTRDDSSKVYKFNYSFKDTFWDTALPVYRSDCILPNHSTIIYFTIKEKSSNKRLLLHYFYKSDFHLKAFEKEILERNWVRRYELQTLEKGFK